MEEKLLKIINHYKVLPQLKYFQSEVFELNEAIINYEFTLADNKICKELEEINKWDMDFYKRHITEEIADVIVMLKQFQYYYNIDQEEIEKICIQKIDRQLDRMKEEE